MSPSRSVPRRVKVVGTVAAVAALAGSAAAAAAPARHHGGPRHQATNVILLLGDGMGDSEITAARNYQVGANGRLNLDRLNSTGAYTTYSVRKGTSTPDYVTDSAASGTGWATGTKTYNGAISVDAFGRPKTTILELAKRAGYRTGDVTTAEVQDATPAVLGAHVSDRDCKGPVETSKTCPTDATENGGRGSIAEQLIRTRPDVLLGGGRSYFQQKIKAGRFAGQTVLDRARARGYYVATSAHGLRHAPRNKPLLGSFAPGTMDLEWVGPKPTHEGTSPSRCRVNEGRDPAQPHLSTMADVAITRLDRLSTHGRGHHRGKGFFLQIEGASIDKQDHAANPCGQIGENVEFDKAVGVALAYQKKHKNTLVIVTGDHGHTSQIVPAGSTTAGATATLMTADNAPMTISYATASTPGGSQQHTGTQIRVAASGPQAYRVEGVTNQTDLFTTMRTAMSLRR